MIHAMVLVVTFAALYAGHQVGDHLVQTERIALHKAGPGVQGWTALVIHVCGYLAAQAVAAAMAVMAGVPLPPLPLVAALAVSGVTHGFIDRRWPVRWFQQHTGSGPWVATDQGMYLSDQAMHIGCLWIAAVVAAGLS